MICNNAITIQISSLYYVNQTNEIVIIMYVCGRNKYAIDWSMLFILKLLKFTIDIRPNFIIYVCIQPRCTFSFYNNRRMAKVELIFSKYTIIRHQVQNIELIRLNVVYYKNLYIIKVRALFKEKNSLLVVGFFQHFRTSVLRILFYVRTHPLKTHAITCASIYATQETMLSRYLPRLKS